MKNALGLLCAFVGAIVALPTAAETVVGADAEEPEVLLRTDLLGGDGSVRKVGGNVVSLARDADVTNAVEVVAGTLRLESPLLLSATYWLDAAAVSTVTANGRGGATKWRSMNGKGATFASQGTAPGYTNTLNGLRVMSFANDQVAYNRFKSSTNLSQRTVYLCLAPQEPSWHVGSTTSYYLSAWGWYGKGQGEHSIRFRSGAGAWENSRFLSSQRLNGSAPVPFAADGTWQILGAFDEYEEVEGEYCTCFPVGVGGYETWTTGKNFSGDIAEVIAFDRVLDETSCKTVENHLAEKWGLQDVVWHKDVSESRRLEAPVARLVVRKDGVFDLNGTDLSVETLVCDGLLTNSAARAAKLTVTGPSFHRGTVAPGVTLAEEKGTSHWTKWEDGQTGSDYFLRSLSAEAFELHARRADTSVATSWCLGISNINREMWTHDKFVLYVRAIGGKRVTVSFTVSHRTNGETVMVGAEPIQVAGRAWRKVVLGLDSDFGLGDRNVDIRQVKIMARVDDWSADDIGGIEVKGFRFCAPDEVAESKVWRAGDTFVSVPSRPVPTYPVVDGALKAFFAFDNEDVIDSVDTHRQNAPDPQQYGGFRETLLAQLDGQAKVVTDLDAADVIVYSRARPDSSLAAAIVSAVRRGVPLYAATEVADPEVEAILPCVIGHDVLQGLPPRQRVTATVDAPSALAEGLNDTTFGIYRSCTAKGGAKTLLGFADGTPALVEGTVGAGKVLYNMLAIGSSLVPGKASPDAFFVRALGYLTGRTLPERPRAVATGDWREGTGEGCFGRFGWQVGSGLLVGALGSRLEASVNDASYELAVPRQGAAARAVRFAGDRAEALSLGGEVWVDGVNACRLDASLGYPGIRWNVHADEIELRLGNLQGFAYVPTSAGGRTVELAACDALDLGDLAEPWILLWNGSESDSPLLLVLAHRPDAVRVLRSEEAIDGLALSRQGGVGVLVPTWLCGAKTVDAMDWSRAVPGEILTAARLWCARAFAYPVTCRETFKIDAANRRVLIRDVYGSLTAANDWNVAPAVYAPVSPVAWTLHDKTPQAGGGAVAAFGAEVGATGLVTKFGDFAVRPGDNEVVWSLPLPSPALGFLPHASGYPEVERAADDCFAAGVVFARGGGVKVNPAKDKARPYAIDAIWNYNMHSTLLGLLRCTENPCSYSAENRALMRRRFAWQMMEPLEALQYKMTCRWRREPVSGVKYTIYMNSPRDVTTVFDPPEYGSTMTYGDSNETVRMILAAVQKAADQMGQYGVVKANWDTLSRQVPSYVMANDDWLILCSGCQEYGGPGSIDMLNAEFAGMMSLARLAEIAGDDAVREQALYRAARRICPTLARFFMRGHFEANGLAVPADGMPSTGYNEDGAAFPAKGKDPWENDFFDMSQGIPRDLIALYDWFGYGPIRSAHLPKMLALDVASGKFDVYKAACLAIGGACGPDDLLAKLRELVGNETYLAGRKKDWPGMDIGAYAEYALHVIAGSPTITDCRDIDLHDAVYDPVGKLLTLDFTPGENAVLAVEGRRLGNLAPGRRTLQTIRPFRPGGLTVGAW